jgi:hypothetical protein
LHHRLPKINEGAHSVSAIALMPFGTLDNLRAYLDGTPLRNVTACEQVDGRELFVVAMFL